MHGYFLSNCRSNKYETIIYLEFCSAALTIGHAEPYFHKLLDLPGACISFPSHSDESCEAGATVLQHRAKYFNDATHRSNGRILRRRI